MFHGHGLIRETVTNRFKLRYLFFSIGTILLLFIPFSYLLVNFYILEGLFTTTQYIYTV